MKKLLSILVLLFMFGSGLHAQQLFIYDEQGNQIIYTENPSIKYIGIKDSVSKNEQSSLITSLEPVSNYIIWLI